MFVSFIYRGNTQLLVSDLLMVGGQTHTHTHTDKQQAHTNLHHETCVIVTT